MATLRIELEIAAEPEDGHTRNQVDRIAGPDVGAVLSRIAQANRATFPHHGNDDGNVILKAVAAAVTAAEAE